MLILVGRIWKLRVDVAEKAGRTQKAVEKPALIWYNKRGCIV